MSRNKKISTFVCLHEKNGTNCIARQKSQKTFKIKRNNCMGI